MPAREASQFVVGSLAILWPGVLNERVITIFALEQALKDGFRGESDTFTTCISFPEAFASFSAYGY
jgi:hypothetical protein